MPVGARVTLRGARMWEFLDRLVSIALPRIRDFRGLNPRSMDGRGNFSLGIREQIIFPEIDYDEIASIRGLDVAITTTAENDEQGLALLRALGMPFTRPENEEDEGENAVDGTQGLDREVAQAAALQDARVQRAATAADARARSTRSSASVESACGISPTRASSRA